MRALHQTKYMVAGLQRYPAKARAYRERGPGSARIRHSGSKPLVNPRGTPAHPTFGHKTVLPLSSASLAASRDTAQCYLRQPFIVFVFVVQQGQSLTSCVAPTTLTRAARSRCDIHVADSHDHFFSLCPCWPFPRMSADKLVFPSGRPSFVLHHALYA